MRRAIGVSFSSLPTARRLAPVLLCLLPAFAAGDTVLVLDGFEGALGSWGNTQLVEQPVHTGKRALKWSVADRPLLDSPRFVADWSDFDELRFWAYCDRPVDFSIPLVFMSEGGYYLADWKLGWEGWKEQRIKLADCKPAHQPAGWQEISGVGFRAQGYGQGAVPPGMALVLDDFTLHSPKDLPHKSLLDWMAEERRKRMQEMKSRGNPYSLSVLDSLKGLKAQPAIKEQFDSCWEFRSLGERALSAAWAAGSDDSPRKGEQVLADHACAIIDYCLAQQKDGSWFYSRKWPAGGDPNCDRFTLGPLMDAIWWLRRLPDMEARWKKWEAPLHAAVDFQHTYWGCYAQLGFTDNKAWGSGAYSYPNQDVFHLFEMELAHRWWGDAKYKDSAEKTLAGLQAQLLPDGGIRYIGPETECSVYHNLNLVWLARYLNLTGDERVRKLIADTLNYYPLTMSNEGFPESYTDCWWKHYWNDGAPTGPEIVAGVTGDAQHKWLANRLLERVGAGTNYWTIYAGMFYRDDLTEQTLPDNWLKLDRNIGGPRGRFGNWYFAGVTGGGARDTFVGAMISDPLRPQPLNGAFLAANIEVGLGGEGARDRTHLYLSGPDDLTAVKVEGDVAALGARYTLRKPYINGVKDPTVPPTPWQATQVWLFTKDCLVGLVELECTEEQTVPYLQGELRFGPAAPLSCDGEGVYHCGALTMRVLGHNFATIEHGPARPGYAQQSTKHSAVTLRTAGEIFAAKPERAVWYAAVLAPEEGPSVSGFAATGDSAAPGFEVVVDGESLQVAFSPARESVEVARRGGER
ncbi:MAG: hypothetical protein COZ06_04050 [Armatimonadetes bacterium CG_4_10_14_3_um_filter_66_18]|nr:hypothetical protein [Armatimonadota bacterium]PIU92246.1 MAG: hypothetical protein COS65_18860 [Armatimonadetes bacterium CG06_land_8_20_14_3_00_66_21]PIY51757.1 MAG: hypothetical protein COZ06_04050 [Armatimonadetes bacterium CG_4_10_14_3_um_filter_66_18]PJB67600.1 MAG: hypothetical protein CO096_15710 [Armatimonadetes bacterium CG_4_9_14_3_um_filter_66_14]